MPAKTPCSMLTKISFFIFAVLISFRSYSQNISLANGYAHNDYWHKRPLYDAFDNGFTHLEADVYLRKGKMVVAHILPIINRHRTLEKLYLEPLLSCINGTNNKTICPRYPITLMIDIKSEANTTYQGLQLILNKYRSILSSCDNGQFVQRQVTIVLTGHKPVDILEKETNRVAFIDEDLLKVNNGNPNNNLYQTASCKYSKLLNWEGDGKMPDTERLNLCSYVKKAHILGEKVRLWASPENPVVWEALLKCGVDLINTDKLTELNAFLTKHMALTASLK